MWVGKRMGVEFKRGGVLPCSKFYDHESQTDHLSVALYISLPSGLTFQPCPCPRCALPMSTQLITWTRRNHSRENFRISYICLGGFITPPPQRANDSQSQEERGEEPQPIRQIIGKSVVDDFYFSSVRVGAALQHTC